MGHKILVIGNVVMELGSEGRNQWVLGNNALEVVDRCLYLGMLFSKDGKGREERK